MKKSVAPTGNTQMVRKAISQQARNETADEAMLNCNQPDRLDRFRHKGGARFPQRNNADTMDIRVSVFLEQAAQSRSRHG